ncbi:MAG TPA: hypothetical protein VGE74_32855 [Gemmata sp.]
MKIDIAELSAEQQEVLIACAKQMAAIAETPEPPAAHPWAARDLAELREYGPRYMPGQWFGDGAPVPEKYRVRYLRAIHELGAAGLLERFTSNGRLVNVKLTTEGEAAAAALMGTAKKKVSKKTAKRKPGSKKAPADAPADAPAPADAVGSDQGEAGKVANDEQR